MTEHELIRGCIRQQANCQRMLFERYAGKMMSVCLRYANDSMEAEDIMQDAFIKIYRYIEQFKFEGSFEGWIRRIVVNTAIRHLEKKKLRFKDIDENGPHVPQLPPQAYTHLGEDDLMKLISQLPEGYRVVFNLNVIEGYSHEEIGEMLNIQPGTSRSQLVKARKMLQHQILQLQKIAV
ncbi:RNA polymerase sigma factor [Sediminibacterium ginsengisoli]|uniref:RNA polymerase sigma-70 factor, ECF subfamily n=1 Tax=Sediminibacterium ginsengisoli TaxID=413434 RepID=A0A1T4QWR9_9BACT|nr:RNA polymerase sigma factor [Sediminibacterium ginsengisoli]SKA07768.1 RNA polymerase sigma-70 factor, ECF subfamily [Sediminibacterium ginsengisoli]